MTEPDIAAAVELTSAVRELIDRVRRLDAPADFVHAVTEQVRAAVAALDPHTVDGPFQQASLRPSEDGRPMLAGKQPDQFFPYSPIVGPLNPIAPPVRMWIDGERMRGEVTVGAAYCGPPSMVHGGVIALLFDELLGAVNVVHEAGAFTGTLTVRYERPTPLGQPLEMSAWVDRMEGRKVFTVGELTHDGAVTARAEGIFIRSPLLPEWRSDADGAGT
jgi:acyl-coenzyme A thioesterase PaaI-like protein